MTMEATEKTLYVCEECGAERKYKTLERNPMYRDCKTCGKKVGMRATSQYDSVAIRRFGSGTEPSKWEQIKNRPKGDF